MNTVELRHQINQWLDQLSPEHLALVANFVDFLNQKQLKGGDYFTKQSLRSYPN